MKWLPFALLFVCALACTWPAPQRTEKPKETPPTIEYSKPQWSNERNLYLLINFEVQNTSSRTLEFVKIEANFYDANDVLIKTEHPYIAKYQSLAPGQRSAATVQTDYDKRIKSARFDFSCKGVEAFAETNIIATEVPKLR